MLIFPNLLVVMALRVHGLNICVCVSHASVSVLSGLHKLLSYLILPVAVVVNERKRSTLIGDGESELIVVHETNFLDFGSVINVV